MSHFDVPNCALVLFGKENIQTIEIDDPALSAGQVRVQISYSAICGTQLGEWAQMRGTDPYLPHCLGHEAVGVVIEKAALVKTVDVGDTVIISWMKNNGVSSAAPAYKSTQGLKINSGECATFIRRAILPENRLTKVNIEKVEPAHALIGCAQLTAIGLLKATQEHGYTIGDRAIVFGLGGIGFACASLLTKTGVKVTGVDQESVISNLKNQLDLPLVRLSTSSELIGLQQEWDFAVIAAGSISAMESALDLLPKNSGALFIIGNPPHGEKLKIETKSLLYGRKIVGVGEKDVSTQKDIWRLVELFYSDKNENNTQVGRRVKIDVDFNEVFRELHKGSGKRTVIDFT
jgi:S-(hydroxymethyl)glutathione dehydrogenase/alcohol dehydrogenase